MAFTTIDDPSAHFQSDLWTGNNTSRSITFGANSELQPDLAWIMGRDIAGNNGLIDSTRGVTKQLWADDQAAEKTSNSGSDLTAFNSDGISLGASHQVDCNTNTKLILGWFWKANGGTTTTNDASATSVGTIDSVYQANTTAGFSIVTYSGSGSAGSIAHGLGVTPDVVIIKNRGSNARGWIVYHHQSHATPEDNFLLLNTNAAVADLDRMNDTAPTSTVFSVSDDTHVNNGSDTYVAYCWNEVPGFSKFGIYEGNNSTDGTFVFLGFRPEVLIIKKTSTTANWIAKTGKVVEHNVHTEISYLDITNAENTAQDMDLLSNGFKHRSTEGDGNHAQTYAYFAWARHPMVSSKGIPGTAV